MLPSPLPPRRRRVTSLPFLFRMPVRLEHFDQFEQFGLSAPLLRGLADAGYEMPSPLQVACLPPLLAGRDLIAQGYTGTGKTLAFVLPLLEGLDLCGSQPQILVLTTSSAMSVQMAELFLRLAKYLPGFHVLPIHGGDGQVVQLRQLERGVHVVIGTPRWVVGHVENGRLDLTGLRTLVLDEADELLRMGFQEDIEAIFGLAPDQLQTAVFAATRTRSLQRLVQDYLCSPVDVILPDTVIAVPDLRQRYWLVEANHKLDALIRLIEVEAHFEAALVCVHTQTCAERLADKLVARGYGAGALHGDTPMLRRNLVVEQLANKRVDIVVTTDLALLDLVLARISHIIHYDPPCDARGYRQRLACAPAAQGSILLVNQAEMRMLHCIEHDIGQSIEPLALPERTREH